MSVKLFKPGLQSIAPTALLLALLLPGCVSIDLNKVEVQRAEDIRYSPPEPPFVEHSTPHVDQAWKNPDNGNSISYLSDCKSKYEPDLETIRRNVLSVVQNLIIKSEEKADYNGRAALRTQAAGDVDGIATQLDLMIFKKNNCIYVLTYVGLDKPFERNRDAFRKFLEGFEAP